MKEWEIVWGNRIKSSKTKLTNRAKTKRSKQEQEKVNKGEKHEEMLENNTLLTLDLFRKKLECHRYTLFL